MKRSFTLSRPLLLPLFLGVLPALGQGSFQNLNFESALIDQTHAPGGVSTTDALPGWTAYSSTNQATQVLFNDFCLGATCISLLGTNSPVGPPIEGGFSVLLQGGVSGPGTLHPTAASIRQTGLVPASSRSVRFKAQLDSLGVPGVLSMSLDGVNIPYVSLSSGPNYTLYGGDISAFAGRTAELGFSLFGGAGIDYSIWNLDSIEFSDLAVPEPSVLGLSLLGALLLGWRHWRKHR